MSGDRSPNPQRKSARIAGQERASTPRKFRKIGGKKRSAEPNSTASTSNKKKKICITKDGKVGKKQPRNFQKVKAKAPSLPPQSNNSDSDDDEQPRPPRRRNSRKTPAKNVHSDEEQSDSYDEEKEGFEKDDEIDEEVLDEGQEEDEEYNADDDNNDSENEGEKEDESSDEEDIMKISTLVKNSVPSSTNETTEELERNPPNHIALPKGASVHSLDGQVAELTLKIRTRTAMKCPCKCGKWVKIGSFGIMGKGLWGCPHCGHRRGEKKGKVVPFTGAADLKTHLDSDKCRAVRGLPPLVRKTDTEKLGHDIAKELGHDVYKIIETVNGKSVQKFKCPACLKSFGWQSKLNHAAKCFAKRGVPVAVSAAVTAAANARSTL